jgi:hypothetical protein
MAADVLDTLGLVATVTSTFHSRWADTCEIRRLWGLNQLPEFDPNLVRNGQDGSAPRGGPDLRAPFQVATGDSGNQKPGAATLAGALAPTTGPERAVVQPAPSSAPAEDTAADSAVR